MATSYYTAPNFHVVFRDATGEPAINGTAEFFRAADHGTHKAVYEDRDGTIPLPNPVTLNSQGVIADATGTPKPVYYADDEPYYVVVRDSGGAIVQTVDNWNSNLAFFPLPAIEESNLTNYILNPQFRYFEKQNLTNTDLFPASHVAEEGWYFYKANSTSTNQIDFMEFPVGQTDVPYNPVYYLKFSCTAAGPETEKRILLKFRDVVSFSGQTMSFGVWARSETGSLSTMRLIVTQRYRTTPTDDYDLTVIETFTVPTTWTFLSKENFTIPSVAGKTINLGEDEFEIALGMPLNQIAIISFTNVQMNLGEIIYDFNYTSSEEESNRKKAYELEQISGLADTTNTNYGYSLFSDGHYYLFRNETGKIETYLLGNLPKYCLPMDGSTYQREAIIPGTGNRVSYNRLYQTWANDSNIQDGNAFGYGSDGFEASKHPTGGAVFSNVDPSANTNWTDVSTGFSINAIHDNSSKGVNVRHETVISKQVGIRRAEWVLWIENLANGNVTDFSVGTTGFSGGVLFQGTASTPESSWLLTNAASTLSGGEYFTYDTPTTGYYVWFTVDGAGADPAVGGRTGLKVPLFSAYDNVKVANIIKSVLNGRHMTEIIANAASTLSGGEYLYAYTASTQFYIWFTVDGVGTDPAIAGRSGILVELDSTDDANWVATKIHDVVRSYYFQVPDVRGYFMRAYSGASGVDPDASERYGLTTANVIYGNRIGTGQADSLNAHWHNVRANETASTSQDPAGNYPSAGTPQIYNSTYDAEMADDMITTVGGNETRAINFTVQWAIRY